MQSSPSLVSNNSFATTQCSELTLKILNCRTVWLPSLRLSLCDPPSASLTHCYCKTRNPPYPITSPYTYLLFPGVRLITGPGFYVQFLQFLDSQVRKSESLNRMVRRATKTIWGPYLETHSLPLHHFYYQAHHFFKVFHLIGRLSSSRKNIVVE